MYKFLLFFLFACVRIEAAELVSVDKIWATAPHSAFTDLVRYRDEWFVTFREGMDHVGDDNGKVRVISSKDGKKWESVALIEKEGFDLRDPKFSITPDGRLMINMAGSVYDEKWEYVTRENFVIFSHDGQKWTSPKKVVDNHEWLWRVSWNKGKAYGVSYRVIDDNNPESDWMTTLYSSENGTEFKPIAKWEITGFPSESTLRFTENGTMIALVRRGGAAWIGVSKAPFNSWSWNQTNEYMGGPNFLILPDGKMIAAARMIDRKESTPENIIPKTALAEMTTEGLKQILTLPSGGDTGYPGMVYHDGYLWMSYYSSHTGKASIYFAKIAL